MKISIEDVRRQYTELSDDGLLEIEREDLVDEARQCYDAELARRHLTTPQTAAPVRPGAAGAAHETEDLVEVASYTTQEEATLARQLVRGAGIPAYLANEHGVAANWALTNALGGMPLLVPGSALKYAREVLAAKVSDEQLAGEAVADMSYVRHGVGAVRPYLYGKLDLLAFVQQVFGSVELERHEFSPTACHVEAMIGDSVLVMEVSDPPHATAAPASIYVYVPDVDAVYARALEAGGISVAVPTDKPYDERSAGVKDSFGNTWWIAAYQGTQQGT